MFPYTKIHADVHAQELREYADQQRLARIARSSTVRPNRLARALSAMKVAVTTPVEEPSLDFLPRLRDYPTRG